MRYLHIAVKNVSREKRRSMLLACAIAFGLMVIILVGSLADGILDSFVNKQSGLISGHVVVQGLRYSSRDQLISRLEEKDPVIEYSREFFGESLDIQKRSSAVGTFVNGSNSYQQMIVGIDADQEVLLKELLIMEKGHYLDRKEGILLSAAVAEELQLEIGDRVMMKTRTLSGMNNVADFIVEGIISEDLGPISDLAAFVQRPFLNQIIGIPEEDATEVHLFLDEKNSSEVQAAQFWQYLKDQGLALVERPEDKKERQEIMARLSSQDWDGARYHIRSLEEIYSFVYVVGAFLNGTALIVMLILLGIILVGIGNTLRMMIFERRREIGTLRAMGMQRRAVVRVFWLEMLIIAALGVLMGSLLALGAGLIIRSITFDAGHTFLSMFLYQKHLTLSFNLSRFAGNAVLILFLVWLASLIPASKAAKIDPARAIHNIS